MNPADWSTPPSYYLLENPWPLGATAIVVGLLLMLHGRRKGRKPPVYSGAVLVTTSAMLLLAAFFVTTDREVMMNATRELVRAAELPVRLDVFRSTLSKEARFFDRDYEQILSTLQRSTDRWGVKQAWITNLAAMRDDAKHGRTYLSLITRLDTNLGGGSAQTRWTLFWQKEADGVWRVQKIEWLGLEERAPSEHDLP